MKRCIAAVVLALLAFPGSALAVSDLRADQNVRGGSLGVAPPILPALHAKGTDVAAPDQQASTRSTAPVIDYTPPAIDSAADDGGFDWADAGIGAAATAALVAMSLAGAVTLRRRQTRPHAA
jgi:hypothetical protein